VVFFKTQNALSARSLSKTPGRLMGEKIGGCGREREWEGAEERRCK